MFSKSKIKLIKSLERRRYRDETGLFVAEGPKVVGELMAVMRPQYVCVTASCMESFPLEWHQAAELDVVSDGDLERASFLRAPQGVVALFQIPRFEWNGAVARSSLCLALDGVQDPGNVGTIVRAADWFGIEDILCSVQTADVYAPKAVQATMGALARVRIHPVSLPQELEGLGAPVYGTFLDGDNLYRNQLGNTGIIVLGNEGNGISPEVEQRVTHRLLIPSYPPGRPTSESLNVGVAASIVLAEFRRREQ